MRKFRLFRSKRAATISTRVHCPPANSESRTPIVPPSSSALRLSELPDDILILIVCNDVELQDLIAIRMTCRRLYAFSYLEHLWVTLWKRLELRGVLLPLRPVEFVRPQRFATEPAIGKTSPGPTTLSKLREENTSADSARCRMQQVFEVQRRIHVHDEEQPIVAQQIFIPILQRPLKDFVAMSMTPAGEILVVWAGSELLVCDLRHRTSFRLAISSDGGVPCERTNFITAFHEYQGFIGVFIVGTFIRESAVSILFQPLPSPECTEPISVPDYHILSEFPISAHNRVKTIQFSQQYLVVNFVDLSSTHPNYYLDPRNVMVFDLEHGQSMLVSRSREYIQRAFIFSNRLFICYDNGYICEQDLKLEDPTCVIRARYPQHTNYNTESEHFFCDSISQKLPHSNNSQYPELRCWRFNPHTSVMCCLTVSVSLTGFKPDTTFPSHFPPPNDAFKLRAHELEAANPPKRPLFPSGLSSPSHKSIQRSDGSINFCHGIGHSVPGRSTLLSLFEVFGRNQEVFMLSHSPRASRTTAGPSDRRWVTTYRLVHLKDQHGRLGGPPSSGSGSIQSFLWNEYAGRIAIATKEPNSLSASVRVYQI
ncbi:hypothetical protein DL93DRAFT_768900 [Clavulina sp. PMI_390]|nr:hypothetical protein DL93DRAFT_768900 [Clavulina sp. PMI_390]